MSLYLTGASDKLRLTTGSAGAIKTHVTYADNDTGAINPQRVNNPSFTTVTDNDVLGSPASGVQRNVLLLVVANVHASISNVLQLFLTDNTTPVPLWDGTLLAGEKLILDKEGVFRVYGTDGVAKTSTAATVRTKSLASDQSNSTVTPTKVTGLSIPVEAGNFAFEFHLRYQAGVTTTGVRFSADFTGTVSSFVQNLMWVDTSATASTAAADQDAVGAAGQVLGAMAGRAKSQAGLGTTISVDTANADMYAILKGLMTVTVAGSLDLWHGSEVAAASSIMAGSGVILTKLNP